MIVILSSAASYNIFAENQPSDKNTRTEQIEKIMHGLKFTEILSDSETVKRDEFCGAVISILNMDDLHMDMQIFYDVDLKNDFFYEINTAAKLGIISVPDNKIFNPNSPIKYTEAIKILVSAAGYSAYAEKCGGYPTGYLIQGEKLKISTEKTDGNISGNDALIMLYNMMNANVMYPVSVNSQKIEYGVNNETVLEYYHGIFSGKGIVTANFISSVNDKNVTDRNYIMIDDITYKAANDQYVNMLGRPIEFYWSKTKDDENELLYVAEDLRMEKITISADDIDSFYDLTYTYSGKKKLSLAKNHTLIVNGKRLKTYTEDDFKPKNGTVTLFKNKNEYFDTVIINKFESMILQRVTAGGTPEITFTEAKSLRSFTVDTENKHLYFELILNGEKVTLDSFIWQKQGIDYKTVTLPTIKQYSVADIYCDEYKIINGFTVPSETAKYISISISDNSVNGILTAVSEGSIYIDDVEYMLGNNSAFKDYNLGDGGTFVLNSENKVLGLIENPYLFNNYIYAYLINAIKTDQSSLSPSVDAKLMLDDGSIKEYTLKDININGKRIKNADELLNLLHNSAKLINPDFTISQLIKIKFNTDNTAITDMQTVLQEVGLPDGSDISHLNRYCERNNFVSRKDNGYMLYLTSNNVAVCFQPKRYFVVPPMETFDDKDYRVASEWINEYYAMSTDIFDMDEHLCPEIIVSYRESTEMLQYLPFVMVDKVGTALDIDGNPRPVLFCYNGTDSIVYYTDDEKMFQNLKHGDIVVLYGTTEEATKCEVVITYEEVTNFDMSKQYQIKKVAGFNVGLYEAYSLNGRSILLQRGSLKNEGCGREFQRLTEWSSDIGISSYGGILYDSSVKNGQIVPYPAVSNIKTAIKFGNEHASKILAVESDAAIMKFIVIYN